MEKLLINPCDKEQMRLAMLKHEEVFKEQVLELHRLYQTQKSLMKIIQRSKKTKCKEKIQGLDLERPAMEECNKNAKMVDESELLELTLGPSNNFYTRKVIDAPLSLLQSDNHSGTSLSSSASNNNQNHHHHQQQQQKMNTSSQENSQKLRVNNHVPIKSNHHNFLVEMKNGSTSEENLRPNISLNNSPPWLFQVLSLKMT